MSRMSMICRYLNLDSLLYVCSKWNDERKSILHVLFILISPEPTLYEEIYIMKLKRPNQQSNLFQVIIITKFSLK